MAFKMSPVGKKKCSYSPMQKKGLINSSPVHMDGNTVSSSGGKSVKVDRPAEQVGGNVNYMVRRGFQPRGEYINNDRGIRIVKYVNKKGVAQYHQFNNNRDSDNKLHRVIDADTFRKMAFTKNQGFVNRKELDEIDSSGAANQSMTDQVTKGKMAGNFEAKS